MNVSAGRARLRTTTVDRDVDGATGRNNPVAVAHLAPDEQLAALAAVEPGALRARISSGSSIGTGAG